MTTLASIGNQLIKVGSSIGLYPSCCCPDCDCDAVLSEVFYNIRNIDITSPFGNASFQDYVGYGFCREDGNATDCGSVLLIANSCSSFSAVLTSMAREVLAGECGSVGIGGGIRNSPVFNNAGFVGCLNSTELFMADNAIFSGSLSISTNNSERPKPCKCRSLSISGQGVGSPSTPWEGQEITINITEYFNNNGCV